jgi:MinD-like ATPase involved in chromosome partitioning or flagellar assembly
LTFAVSKGGVGKSLLAANVGAALASRGNKVVLVEGDPNRPLQLILNSNIDSKAIRLEDVVKKDIAISKAVSTTRIANLFLVPSGVSLESYFEINPVRFAKKLMDLNCDYMIIDTPFPLGEAAFLSLGVCQYFLLILTEDEFTLCVEAAIDTIRLGKYYLKCIPLGFVLNRIKTPKKFNEEFVRDLEHLLDVPCLAKIDEDSNVSKSYGGAKEAEAFLAYTQLPNSSFHKSIDQIASCLERELPKPEKRDAVSFLKSVTKPVKT